MTAHRSLAPHICPPYCTHWCTGTLQKRLIASLHGSSVLTELHECSLLQTIVWGFLPLFPSRNYNQDYVMSFQCKKGSTWNFLLVFDLHKLSPVPF